MLFSRILPLCIATAFTTSLAVLDLPNAQPKVDEAYWNKALDSTWQGLVRRNIQPYSAGAGLIHRPKSETPGDAVSEGVGYGMLVSLYANDQASFNKMWEQANTLMWSSCYYNWQMGPDGKITGLGAASDAEDVNGVSVVAKALENVDMNGMRDLGDSLKEKLGSCVVILASAAGPKVNLMVMATDDAVKRGAHAGNIIREAAKLVGGGGGGRPNLAQAGGKNAAGIPDAIRKAQEIVRSQIK